LSSPFDEKKIPLFPLLKKGDERGIRLEKENPGGLAPPGVFYC
jgi:hypothetical protein